MRPISCALLLVIAGCWTSSPSTTPDTTPPPKLADPEPRPKRINTASPIAHCPDGFIARVTGTLRSGAVLKLVVAAGRDKHVDMTWTATLLPSTPLQFDHVAPANSIFVVNGTANEFKRVELCPP